MDEQHEKLLQKQLEAKRQTLSGEQRRTHDQFCALLKANETYTTEFALKGAETIREHYGAVRLKAELQNLATRAENFALVEGRRATQEVEKQKVEPAQALEHQLTDREQAEQARRAEKTAAAQREPIPGSIQRFDEKIKQRQVENHEAALSRAADAARNRPNYARYNELKAEQSRGSEQSDLRKAKLEALNRRIDAPKTDKEADRGAALEPKKDNGLER